MPTRGTLLLALLCSLYISKAGKVQFNFGIKTTNNVYCTNPNNITITLFWQDRRFQCEIQPKEFNKEYICNTSSDSHIECDALSNYVDGNSTYAIQIFQADISSYQNSKCVDQIFIQTVNATTINATDEYILNTTDAFWGEYTGSNIWIDLNDALSNATNITTPTIQTMQRTPPICYPFVTITISACDLWNYGSTSNTLQMKLLGSNGATEFFFVNKLSPLPTESESFYISDIGNALDVGDLYSVHMSVDDEWGFCVKALTVKISNDIYTFSEAGYFGSGIILSNECRYSYQYLSDDYPLISCHAGVLQLDAYSLRGIYKLHMHTCITEHSGMTASNMKDRLYAVMMGKKVNEDSYSTTEISYLDHFEPKAVNLQQLGNLIAGNVLLPQEFTTTYPMYSTVDATIIGIKIESVDYQSYPFNADDIVTVDGFHNLSSKTAEDGRYFLQFFTVDSRRNISAFEEIYVWSSSVTFTVNVFLIFEEFTDSYQLPFKLWESAEFITWPDARQKCLKNGTDLVSVHSELEQYLITGFIGTELWDEGGSVAWPYLREATAWIGMRDYSLQKQQDWRWIDASVTDYTNWGPNWPDKTEHCASSGVGGLWRSWKCNNPDAVPKYLCATPQWNTNTHRTFEINVNTWLEDITLLSLGNNNIEDEICIDYISINDAAAVYISDNWVGGQSGVLQASAVFRYPVCDTTVLSMRVEYDNLAANYLEGDSEIAGLQCINNGRQTDATCSVSQTFQFTTTTSYGISNSESSTQQYSWGSSSAVTLGESLTDSYTRGRSDTSSQTDTSSHTDTSSQTDTSSHTDTASQSNTNSYSHTSTDSFSWGLSEKVSATAKVGLFGMGGSVTAEVGSHQDWSHSSSNTNSQSASSGHSSSNGQSTSHGQSSSNGYSRASGHSQTASESNTNSKTNSQSNSESSNQQNTDSASSTSGTSSTYATTETTSVQCSASINVPPSHSIQYTLNFNAVNMTVNTYTNLKLTLCSAFVNPSKIEVESSYIYLSNIPGVLEKKETKACTVDFEPAEYIRNSVACSEEQQLAIFSGSTYLPRCQNGNSSLYDGCQCDKGDLSTLSVCWCVDETGNEIGSRALQVDEDKTYTDVCVNQLKCQNTRIEYTMEDPFNSVVYNSAIQTKASLAFVIVFSVIFCVFCLVYVYNSYLRSKVLSTNNQMTVNDKYQKL